MFIDGGVVGTDATAYALAAVVDDIVVLGRSGATKSSALRDGLDLLAPFSDRIRGVITL